MKKDPDEVTTIYFDDSQLNWGNIKAYVYDESGSDVIKNAAWPGEAMEYDSSTGLYSYDVPDELTKGLVIFSGDNGRYPGDGAKGLEINETNMIFKAGNSWTPYNGEHVDPKPTEDPNNSVTVYVNAASLGYSSPNIYYWSSKTDSGPKQWPGVAMTKYSTRTVRQATSLFPATTTSMTTAHGLSTRTLSSLPHRLPRFRLLLRLPPPCPLRTRCLSATPIRTARSM